MGKRMSILVSEETHAWLTEEARRLVAESERPGGYQCPAIRDEPRGGKLPLSLEQMLLILLDDRQRHRERRRKSRLNRKPKPKRLPSGAAMRRDGLAGG